MVVTRADSARALNHVLESVKSNRSESGLKASLLRKGISDIHDLINDDIIDTLQFFVSEDSAALRDVNR
jgi:hypothetical protein